MSWLGIWQRIRGEIKQRFGELTDDDLAQAGGSRDKLIGRLRQKYGMSKQDAEDQVDQVITGSKA
jgi:uncharacterized protein YjbJ (UPF0337 family)